MCRHRGSGERACPPVTSPHCTARLPLWEWEVHVCLMAFDIIFIFVFQRNSAKPKAGRKDRQSPTSRSRDRVTINVLPTKWRNQTPSYQKGASPGAVIGESTWLEVGTLVHRSTQTPSAGINRAIPTSLQRQVPEK